MLDIIIICKNLINYYFKGSQRGNNLQMSILLIIIIVYLLYSRKKLKSELSRIAKELDEKNIVISNYYKEIKFLKEKISSLSKYESILDAEEKASEIVDAANEHTKMLKARYEFIITTAAIQAKKIAEEANFLKKKANEEINEKKKKYEHILTDATLQANKIIENANERAKEIAGEALEALNNTKNLEKTAEAMKNIINGYDNKYIVPTRGLLDELADDFGYTEAGKELKNARERTRLMVTNRTAAKCDYVESNRRETAINFVIDAFNGKVDTILSTVKHDNYGILEQKIKDSFQVVNNLGQAFRNAAITEEYLFSRLEELKWGVLVNELKLKEKEEQRLIKEQMREEERARREYEKAMKEAAKEEELLKKLMEKARKELSEANEQQKAKYEQQLSELADKLKAAEEKNQRALSLAQQTKAGHVYIISNIGSFGEDVYKIGMTRRLDPNDRVKELGDASVPFSFDIHAMIFSDDAPGLETELHKKFTDKQVNRVNSKKEFFKVSLKELKDEIESLGINAKWTITAEAKEYRESLAIEKSLVDRSFNQEKWISNQLETVGN